MIEYIFMVISALVIITCVYFVIAPFFAKNEVVTEGGEQLQEETTIESIYRAVNELEMEFLMKRISEESFQQTKEKYESMAAILLNEERKKERKRKHKKEENVSDIEAEIMKELEAMRRSNESGKEQ